MATKTRDCRHCGQEFEITVGPADANRQHCSRQCAKSHNAKRVKQWHADHPEILKGYQQKREYNATEEAQRKRKARNDLIEFLGGSCVVCGVANPLWLHIDFIPGSRDLQYRHSRGVRYMRENADLFRILCANHHYELTITGAIAGTDITQ